MPQRVARSHRRHQPVRVVVRGAEPLAADLLDEGQEVDRVALVPQRGRQGRRRRLNRLLRAGRGGRSGGVLGGGRRRGRGLADDRGRGRARPALGVRRERQRGEGCEQEE